MCVAKILSTVLILVFVTSDVSVAQDVNETQSYSPDYFAQFQPITARDMLSRIPGFTLQGGGNNDRGFGQANLNILINGRRPSSKSSNANDILGRITANTVERIEIVDGASLDIPGLSGQVANIITSTGELSGNWEYVARLNKGLNLNWGKAISLLVDQPETLNMLRV